MHDLVIRGGTVIDGTGGTPYVADIAIDGGLIAKVSRTLDDAEVEIEISQGVKVRLLRTMISDVRTKGEPVKE